MAAEFEAHRALALEDRNLFAVVGVIRSGMLHTGMRAVLEGGDVEFDEPVHGVEYLDAGAEGEGKEPALLFSYSRPEQLEAWRSIEWTGRVFTLTW